MIRRKKLKIKTGENIEVVQGEKGHMWRTSLGRMRGEEGRVFRVVEGHVSDGALLGAKHG